MTIQKAKGKSKPAPAKLSKEIKENIISLVDRRNKKIEKQLASAVKEIHKLKAKHDKLIAIKKSVAGKKPKIKVKASMVKAKASKKSKEANKRLLKLVD